MLVDCFSSSHCDSQNRGTRLCIDYHAYPPAEPASSLSSQVSHAGSAATTPQLTEFEQRMQAALEERKHGKKGTSRGITVRQSTKGPEVVTRRCVRKTIMSKPAGAHRPGVVISGSVRKAIMSKPAGASAPSVVKSDLPKHAASSKHAVRPANGHLCPRPMEV